MKYSARYYGEKVARYAAFVLVALLIFSSIVSGFRIPGRYVLSQYMLTYQFGFIPRGLIGSVMRLLCGDAFFTYLPHVILALGTTLLFFLWLLYTGYRACLGKDTFLIAVLIGWFTVCCYGAYYTFESGYYEQFGYVFVILLIEQIARKKDGSQRYIVWSAVYMALSCLISETNAFLVCPLLVFITFLQIWKEHGQDWKRCVRVLVKACLMYLPSGVFCVIVNFYRVPEETVQKLIEVVRERTTLFPYLEALGGVMYGPRTPVVDWFTPFTWRKPQTFVLIVLAAAILTITFFIAFYWKDWKKAAIYFITTVVLAFLTYSIVFVAWDFDRYYCCMVVTNLLFSIYILKVFAADGKRSVEPRRGIRRNATIAVVCAATLVVLSTREAKLWLMDNGTYNETWSQFTEKLTQGTDGNGKFSLFE